MADYRVFWGEGHDNTYQFAALPVPIDEVYARAASHLDFYAAAYYTAFASAFQPGGHASETKKPHDVILEGWKSEERLDREWAEIQEASSEAYEAGRFVTFPGYEWQGDGTSGDHNVYASREGLPVFRVKTIAELYECLRGRDALAIPHHTAYRRGCRGRDWSVFDEELSPFAEIYSIHGCSETDEEWIGLRQNSHMGPGFGGGTYQDALDRGYHIGAVCSTDMSAARRASTSSATSKSAREPCLPYISEPIMRISLSISTTALICGCAVKTPSTTTAPPARVE